jgi:hypothetical protein
MGIIIQIINITNLMKKVKMNIIHNNKNMKKKYLNKMNKKKDKNNNIGRKNRANKNLKIILKSIKNINNNKLREIIILIHLLIRLSSQIIIRRSINKIRRRI